MSAAAIALQQARFEVEIFEQAPELHEVGGGVVLREPSMRLLARWGALDTLQPKMVAVNQVEMRDSLGHILGTTPTAVEAGESEYAYFVHRADLHDALIYKLLPERLHLGHRLTSIGNLADRAQATFENGRQIHARLVVGADGLRSVVRTVIDATPMTFLGIVVQRTVAPAALLPANMPHSRMVGRKPRRDSSPDPRWG